MKYIVTLNHGDELECSLGTDGFYTHTLTGWRVYHGHPCIKSVRALASGKSADPWYGLKLFNDLAEERMLRCCEFAKSQDIYSDFIAGLGKLHAFRENDHPGCETEVLLCRDFAPYSFTFGVTRIIDMVRKPVVSGGWLYQGPLPETTFRRPRFNVSLAEGTGWFIHT